MLNNAKIWMLLSGVIVLVSCFGMYTLIKSKADEKANFISSMSELNIKINQLEAQITQLEQVKKEKAELEAKFQSDITALETQISDAKRSESQLKSKIETIAKEKADLVKYSENNGLIIAKLQKKIELLEKEKRQVMQEAKNSTEAAPPRYFDPMDDSAAPAPTNTNRPEMGSKLVEEEIVDLGRILIREETNEAAKVENVNTLYGFIIISAGSDDGLRKDSIVNITRNNRLVAKAVVKKVRESTASAVTLPEWTREEIRVGDIISSAQLDAPPKEPFFKRIQ